MRNILFLLLNCLFLNCFSQDKNAVYLIPQPVSLEYGNGQFSLTENTCIETDTDDKDVNRVAGHLSKRLSGITGLTIPVKKVRSFGRNSIRLQLLSTPDGKREGYTLNVSSPAVSFTADSAAGLFYAVQTFLQLLPTEKQNNAWNIPAVTIADYPRFAWRGAMFDVVRHFFTKQDVKEFIDNMVRYKFNVLHLHLTDDQGWRIEIKSLPKLISTGAWRPERLGKWGNTPKPSPEEPKTYGGFYTHEDIREIVQYAQDNFVSVLPEIDVPGHSMAAVASYPELSCTTDSVYAVNVGNKFINWHSKGFTALSDNTLCPANEKVYEFLDKVFTEVAALFPFEYIHIGGDECPKDFWLKSVAVKALMKKEQLKDMHQVQGYFEKRVAKIVGSKGKKILGWDEILEGDLPQDAGVMCWRGMKYGIQAAKLGHKVVMSPAQHAYLDLYQGDPLAEPPSYSMVRLRDAYTFDPAPEGVDEKMVLGGQGNLWAEQIQNMRAAQYMMWPRGLAVAESVWSARGKKDWKSFTQRVEAEFERMDTAQIKYSRSMFDPICKVTGDIGKMKLEMETEIEGLIIYYSYDGSNPDNFYPAYTAPLNIPADVMEVKVITYRNNEQVGKQISLPVTELQKRLKKK